MKYAAEMCSGAMIHKSKSKSCCNWRSVSLSVLVSSPSCSSWPDVFFFVKVAVLSIWGALSDERSGLSFVTHSQAIVSIYIYLQFNLTLISTSMYYIYKDSVSPGSVQQPWYMYIRIFIKIILAIRKLMEDTQTYREHGLSLLSFFFKVRESRLKHIRKYWRKYLWRLFWFWVWRGVVW
jgi:hypothetical protein